MKKTLIAIAALAAFAGVAHAQSVSVYGLLDGFVGSSTVNVTAVNGTAVTSASRSTTLVNSDGLNGSRWGLRGSEDLGGGLTATFNLESGFGLDTGASGQSGLLFGRRAIVGLASKDWGTVTLGRNSSSYSEVALSHAQMGGGTVFDPSNNNNGFFGSNVGTSSSIGATVSTAAVASTVVGRNAASPQVWLGYQERINNSVKYVTPNFSGLTGSFTWATGENNTASLDASQTISASARYVAGPLMVAAGYQTEGGTVSAGKKPSVDNTILAATYDLKVAKLGAAFNTVKWTDVTVTGAVNGSVALTIDQPTWDEFAFSVSVPFGATTLSGTYAESKGSGPIGTGKGFGVQVNHAMSKRTTVYGGYVSTDAHEGLVNLVKLNAANSVDKRSNFAVGVRHTF